MKDLTLQLLSYNETSTPERVLVNEIRYQVRAHNARLDGGEPDLQALFRVIVAYLETERKVHKVLKKYLWFIAGGEINLRNDSYIPY